MTLCGMTHRFSHQARLNRDINEREKVCKNRCSRSQTKIHKSVSILMLRLQNTFENIELFYTPSFRGLTFDTKKNMLYERFLDHY